MTTIKKLWSKIKNNLGEVLTITLLSILFVIIVYPLIWTVLSSFKSTSEIFSNIWGLPKTWLFQNYVQAWDSGVAKYFFNSVFVTLATVVLTLVCACLYAYSMVIHEFKLKKVLMVLTVIGMLFSPIVSLIPLYQEIQKLGLYNTRLSLIIIYTAYQIPISFLLIHDHFKTINHDYLDAARIDGCTDLQALAAIFVPMSKPILVTSAVLTGFYAWNEFSFALILVKNDALRTIPVGLLFFKGEMHTEWAVLLAGLVISAIPIIVFFIFAQRYFIAGLSGDGIKG
ncbi:MAG: carbohydrate ABC transporter permease [Anaerolineaceae bacterium]|nr:carbohydrate ABC transporter permease [Anaerolineaceae bacterium]